MSAAANTPDELAALELTLQLRLVGIRAEFHAMPIQDRNDPRKTRHLVRMEEAVVARFRAAGLRVSTGQLLYQT